MRAPLGLRYMAEAALYFSLMGVFVKVAGARGVPWVQIAFARSLFALAVTGFMLRRARLSPWGHARGWLALRGVLGVIGLLCFYYSVTHLPLGDATVIQYINPIFVALFAVVVVGERLHARDVLAAALCIGGVALIARPSFLFGGESRIALVDVSIAMTGALVSGLAYAVVRRLGRTDDPLVTVLWFPLIAAPVTLPLAIAAGYLPNLVDVAVLLMVGVTSQLAQVRMTTGLKLERAGRATAVTYLQVVFAFIFGAVLFGEVPTVWAIAGALVIAVTTIGLTMLGPKPKSEEADLREERPVDSAVGTASIDRAGDRPPADRVDRDSAA